MSYVGLSRFFCFITNPKYYGYDIYIRLVHTHRYMNKVFSRIQGCLKD